MICSPLVGDKDRTWWSLVPIMVFFICVLLINRMSEPVLDVQGKLIGSSHDRDGEILK